MNRMFFKTLLGLATLGLTISTTHAAVVAIDSVTLGGSNELLTATVGGTAYSGGVIADATADNRANNMTLTVGAAAPAGTVSSASDVHQGAAIDNDLLTGVAGSVSSSQSGGILSLKWNTSGGGFTDNDADPDFFVFEDLGNDSVFAYAILGDGTLGAGVALSGWNVVRTDGVLNGGEFTGRSVAGVAFDFTDLKDAAGVNLTNGPIIQGIVLGDANDADFYEVYGNVSPIPEPSAAAMLGGFGLLALLRRRR
ncbi:hypothetical protein [Haloferula sp. A504]|uniref:hypothetical protein n=1 Tax=Haloferula sp. A504 TaxID=3373601 RepID=UPI0031C46A66|nr:hypothetical protein [Verrucomicrobiaceae bacterium E54]